MEDLETRVWQRVLGQPEQSLREDLKPLILNAQEQVSAYGQLMKETSGGNRELLQKLYEAEKTAVACLKGISTLQGRPVTLHPLQAPKEPAGRVLEKCYHRTRRAATEYMARSAGGEFGEVFRQLAERERENCVRIAEIMGRWKNK